MGLSLGLSLSLGSAALGTGGGYPAVGTFVALGDSITQASEDAEGHKQQYPVMMEFYSLGGMRMLRNAGVSGETSTEMLARVSSEVVSYAPDACILMGFTNDTNTGMTNAATAANLGAIKSLLDAASIRLILAAAPPLTTSEGLKVSQESRNAACQAWANANGVQYLKPWPFAVDAGGDWKTDYSPDDIHPYPKYYGDLAEAMLALISHPPRRDRLATSNTDPANLVFNGLMLDGAGIPTGWNDISGTNNGLVSMQPADFALGNSLTISFPDPSTGARTLNCTAGPATPGRVYEFSCLAKASGQKNGAAGFGVILADIAANFSPTGATYRPAFNLLYDDLMLIRGQYVPQAGAAYIGVRPYNGGIIGGTGDVKFAQMTLRDITDLGEVATDWPWV